MMFSDFFMTIIILIHMGTGVFENSFYLFLYAFSFFTGHVMKPIDSIFVHVFLANSIVLLLHGILQTLVSFELRNVLDAFECKFILCIHRVACSVSLSTMCLISGFLLIVISPSNSRWSRLKIKAPKYIVPSCLLCWCFYLLINFTLMGIISNKIYVHNNASMWNLRYCSVPYPMSFYAMLYVIAYSLPDIVYLGFMICINAYLMILLHRYHQQALHIPSLHLSPRSYPKIRATYTILLLVCSYVCFYSINSALALSIFQLDDYYPFLMIVTNFIASCFPAISPFVVITCDSQILKFWYALWHGGNFRHHPVPKSTHTQQFIITFRKAGPYQKQVKENIKHLNQKNF